MLLYGNAGEKTSGRWAALVSCTITTSLHRATREVLMLINIIFFTLSMIFFSLWLDHKFRIHAAAHPIIVYSCSTLILYIGGIVGLLGPTAWGLIYGGGIGLLAMLALRVKWLSESWSRVWPPLLLFGLFMGVLWFYFMAMPEMYYGSTDHVKHWGLVSKMFFETGSFYREFYPLLQYLSYPPLPVLGTYLFCVVNNSGLDNAMLVGCKFASFASLFCMYVFVDFRRLNVVPCLAVAIAGAVMIAPEIFSAAMPFSSLLVMFAVAVAAGYFLLPDARARKELFVFVLISILVCHCVQREGSVTLKDMQLGFFIAACLALYFGVLRKRSWLMLLWLVPLLLNLQMIKPIGILQVAMLIAIVIGDKYIGYLFHRRQKMSGRRRWLGLAVVCAVVLAPLVLQLSWSVFLNTLGRDIYAANSAAGLRESSVITAIRTVTGVGELGPVSAKLHEEIWRHYWERRIYGAVVPKEIYQSINALVAGSDDVPVYGTIWLAWVLLAAGGLLCTAVLLLRRMRREALCAALASFLFLGGCIGFYLFLGAFAYQFAISHSRFEATLFRYYQVMFYGEVFFLAVLFAMLAKCRDKWVVMVGMGGLLAASLIFGSVRPKGVEYISAPHRAIYKTVLDSFPEAQRFAGLSPFALETLGNFRKCVDYYPHTSFDFYVEADGMGAEAQAPREPIEYDKLLLYALAKDIWRDGIEPLGLPYNVGSADPQGGVAYILSPSADGKHQVIMGVYAGIDMSPEVFYTFKDKDDIKYYVEYEIAAPDRTRKWRFNRFDIVKENGDVERINLVKKAEKK